MNSSSSLDLAFRPVMRVYSSHIFPVYSSMLVSLIAMVAVRMSLFMRQYAGQVNFS